MAGQAMGLGIATRLGVPKGVRDTGVWNAVAAEVHAATASTHFMLCHWLP